MARTTYKGFDLPDGAEVPDVPADLRKVVDGVSGVARIKSWYTSHAAANANGAAGTWYNLMPASIVREDLGGLVTVLHMGRYVPWGANGSSGSVQNQILFTWGGTLKWTAFGGPWPYSTAAAPGAAINPGVVTVDTFVLPPNVGDVTVQLQGRSDFAAGWVGCNMEFTLDRLHVIIAPFGTRSPVQP